MDRCSIDAHGTALTDETIAAAKSADAVLLGGPECGNGAVRPEPGLLKLRKGMDINGKLWPCFFASGSLVDASLPEASVCRGTVLSSSLYTPALFTLASAERVDRMAGFLARGRGDKKVGSLDKANLLATKGHDGDI
ncbi:3-isopropylmalate dehydrogenase [Fusarium sp. NRRL 25303]|nr:3-isopropylmalate dehydrogenase [Fusarium sp. NRRL 25303]